MVRFLVLLFVSCLVPLASEGALWLVKMRRKHVPRFGVVQSSLGRNRYVVASATPPPTRDAGIKRFERYHPHSPKVHRGGGRFVHKRIRSGECERGRVASLTTEFDENCTLWSLPYSTNVSVRSTDTLVEMASFIYNETGMHPYNGSTRVGALIDTGVDATHCSFYDPSHPVSYYTYNGFAMSPPASSHAKIAGYFRLGTGSDFEGDYTDGHGTHVAGIQWGNPCGATRGIDYGARFVFFDASGDVNDQDSLYIPGNLYGIFQTAVNLGASYTSSSWGSDSSGYDGYSYQFDAAANDYELLHVVSAGNSGGPGYIGSPANAKNVVSVGATMVSPDVRPQLGVNYGYRPDLFTRFDVAAFSSYGPTLDGRFGPILAAPGVGIKSSRGIRNSVYAHSDFILMSGTSMAAPGIPSAGLEERLEAAGFSHSSAALRRAFLISATRPMERVVDLWGGVAIEITPTNRAAAGFGILDFDPEFWRGGGNLSAKWSVRDYATVGPSGDTSCFTVPSGSDVVVVLAWTDPPYEPLIASQTTTLVNDLDLHVESRSECRWGNHGNSSDTVNNNEIVRFRSEGGFEETMRVVVSDPFASGQKYALVVYSSGGLVATPCNATCTSHDPPLECDVANGDGYRLCAEGGTWNSTCTPYACLDGYRLSENSTCVALANATAPACLVANGSGRVLDNATCLVTECDEKYAWNGTDCAPTGGVDACVYVSDSFQAPPGLVVSGGEIAHATTMYLALFAFASTCIGA